MNLPPLYKYLDVRGAKLTLQNGNFRHAKPSEFNDIEDLTIRSIFPESEEAALKEINDNFTDVLVKNLAKEPTCINLEMREKIALIQQAYRNHPNAAKVIKEYKKADIIGDLYDLDALKQRSKGYVDQINQFMQDFRILCVSEEINSARMWERYAQGHEGFALRILPNEGKDSKFLRFRKVGYFATRPPLYKNVLEYLESSLFGNQDERFREIMDEIIYSKTLEWQYENEYRLAIPIVDGKDWNTMPYHPEELSELYLGHKASEETKIEILRLAKTQNPGIKVFHTYLTPDGRLQFSP